MGLFDAINKGMNFLAPERERAQLQNKALREGLLASKRQQEGLRELSGLFGPNTAPPSIRATPQQTQQRMMQAALKIAPEQAAASLFQRSNTPRDIEMMQRFDYPLNREGYQQFLRDRQGSNVVTEDKPVSISDLARLQLPNGDPVPPGTTYGQLQKLGAKVVTADERKDQGKKDAALRIVSTARDYLDIFKDIKPGLWNRARAAGESGMQLLTQENPRYAEYDSYVKGVLAPVVKALGDSGALAEGDVGRASNLFPQIFPFPDTGDVAEAKLDSLDALLKPAIEKHRQITGQDLMASFAPPEPAPAVPSLPDLTDEMLEQLIQERQQREQQRR